MTQIPQHPSPRLIVILGPTAGGKSDLAVALAQSLRSPSGQSGEVISADSMQIYQGMDAGTAKPSPQLRAAVPHHFIDILPPSQRFTVADWITQTDALIDEMLAKKIWPIVVGGTNLYIKALLEGLFEGPAIDEDFRASLAETSPQELHKRLQQIDPPTALKLHPNDHKKIVRALEVFHLTGKPISEHQTQWTPGSASDTSSITSGGYRHNPILIGLHWPVEAINPRINLRVKSMFFPQKAREQDHVEFWPQKNLVDETRALLDAGLLGPSAMQAREALGYKQVLEHFAGQMSLDDAFERTKILTRRYAKTQRTWLKRFRGVHWLPAHELTPQGLLEQALQAVCEHTNV